MAPAGTKCPPSTQPTIESVEEQEQLPRKKAKINHPKPYFILLQPASWDIVNFLDWELSNSKAHFSHSQALNDWMINLRRLRRNGTPHEKTTAILLLDHYHNHQGSLTDKTRANNWRVSRSQKKPNSAEKFPVQNIYYGAVGAVNQFAGNLHGSPVSVDVHGQPVTPTLPSPRDPSQSSTLQSHTVQLSEYGGDYSSSEDDVHSSSDDEEDSEEVPNLENIPGTIPSVYTDPQEAEAVPQASPAASPAVTPDSSPEILLPMICKSMQEQRATFCTTLTLPTGRILEDSFIDYAMGLNHLDPAHGFILDNKLLSRFSELDRSHITSLLLPLPVFPKVLTTLIKKLTEGTPTTLTVPTCRNAAGTAIDPDVLWICRVMEHMVELIKNDIFSSAPGEGMIDSAINPVFWDNYFLDIPGMILRRKELTISSMRHQPYNLISWKPRYDGVLRTRLVPTYPTFELALFEVSGRFDSVQSPKWRKDKIKLITGCRAMLYRLRELVHHEWETLSKLRVVGVMHAGRSSQLLIMQFANPNIFHLREGGIWDLPTSIKNLGDITKVLSVIWKAKTVLRETSEIIRVYLNRKDRDESDPEGRQGQREASHSAPDFL